jgi:hypothetical protein
MEPAYVPIPGPWDEAAGSLGLPAPGVVAALQLGGDLPPGNPPLAGDA